MPETDASSRQENALPAPFDDLAPFAARWARQTEFERGKMRIAASAADFEQFYQYKLEAMPQDVRRLFELTCAFAEASPHHGLYEGKVPHSFDARRVVPTHVAFAPSVRRTENGRRFEHRATSRKD